MFIAYCTILSTDYSIDIAQYCTENSMDITQYYPPQWKLRNSPEFNGYGSILSTEYSMDFSYYSPQNTELMLLNNIRSLFNGYRCVLSTEYLLDIAQYCPKNIQKILRNTLKKVNGYRSILSGCNGNCAVFQNSVDMAQY